MSIRTFELERVQSLFENTVEFNLTESGIHPFTIGELLTPEQTEQLTKKVLGYGQTNGSKQLRRLIATMYDQSRPENFLITNGSSEANFVACHTLLQQGDEVVMMVPNYMQIWGIAEEMGCKLKAFHLREENQWKPDLEELRSLVSPQTKMIVLCNPNNPTGYIMNEVEMHEVIEIAGSVNAWIYADEIYRGAELDGTLSESFFGKYDKVLVNGGLSKAFALPGLRLGWLSGPEAVIANAWAYHDYTSISAGIISQYLAEIALESSMREKIFARNRKILNGNLETAKQWIERHSGLFHYTAPRGGGMLFITYNPDINSSRLAEWLRINKSVFILAGDVFGMDKHFRIGIGAQKEYLSEGLIRISQGIEELFRK